MGLRALRRRVTAHIAPHAPCFSLGLGSAGMLRHSRAECWEAVFVVKSLSTTRCYIRLLYMGESDADPASRMECDSAI